MSEKRFNTIAVTGNFRFDEKTGSTTPPLYLTNAYQFKTADSAAGLFNLTEGGYIYTRLHNPTTTELEERLAALEGGVGAVATCSGQAAELLLIATLCNAGDEIVASNRLYGGTLNLLTATLKKLGIKTINVDQNKPEEWEKAVTDKTKLFYMESLSNPGAYIPDFDGIIAVAKKHKIPVAVDNTMASPYLFRPIDVDANIVIHSTTKYIAGNGAVMGGVVVDLGNFDWDASGRFADFCAPNESYHGVEFTKAFGKAALAVHMRVNVLRDTGGCPSPFNSYVTMLGLQTLHLRISRSVENCRELAKFLGNHPGVASVSFPELPNHVDYAKAKKFFPKGAGATLTFELKGGYENAKAFVENLELLVFATNIGDARTVVTHPASTTHRQSNDEQLKKADITKTTIRLSVGIEDVQDIIDDIDNALKKAQQ